MTLLSAVDEARLLAQARADLLDGQPPTAVRQALQQLLTLAATDQLPR